MERGFLSNFQVNGQPLPDEVVEAILAEHQRELAAVRNGAAPAEAAQNGAAQNGAAQNGAAPAEAVRTAQREQALLAREARLDCREYLSQRGLPAALLDVLDCSDAERFKAAVEALLGQFPGLAGGRQAPPPYAAGTGSGLPGPGRDPIAAAFRI